MAWHATGLGAAAGLPPHYPARMIDTRGVGARESLLLRPVLPQDATLLAHMMQAQPAQALRWRFHGAVRPSAHWCQRMSLVDYRRELALVVCTTGPEGQQLLAEARYTLLDNGDTADCALMVDTRWHRQGLGRWLLSVLRRAAAEAGVTELECEVLSDNRPMLSLAQRCGFEPMAGRQVGPLLRMHSSLAAERVVTH